MSDDTLTFLAGVPGFDRLSEVDLARALSASDLRTVAAGEHLIHRGEPGNAMYVVRTGSLKVPVFDDSGRLRLMAHVGPREIVGEMALLTGEPRSADAIAEEDTEVLAFERATLMPLIGQHPSLARFLTEILGKRLEEAGGIRSVGKYRLLDKIGEGATAKVFEAVHPGLGRTVAVKMLSHELVSDRRFRDRFLDEGRTVATLGHPHIVQVFDTEQAYGTCFVIMERLGGENLLDYLTANAPLEPGEAMAILEQVGSALGFAHSRGIVHRDVKPANISIDGDGTVKLMDFGIAARTSQLATSTEMVEGTPRYIAPEAAKGDPVDGRADLYSLGVIAFEMVTGQQLFPAKSVQKLLEAHVMRPPPDLARIRPGLPPGLVLFIQSALKKHPRERPADWEGLRPSRAPAADRSWRSGSCASATCRRTARGSIAPWRGSAGASPACPSATSPTPC